MILEYGLDKAEEYEQGGGTKSQEGSLREYLWTSAWLNTRVVEDLSSGRFLWSDNTGEDKKIEELCIEKDTHNKKFEYTTVGMPQQNGKVERKFVTLYGKNHIDNDWCWDQGTTETEATNMSTDLDNVLVENKYNKNVYGIFNNKFEGPNFVFNLRKFGEVGFILIKRKMKYKQDQQYGKKGIMVG